MKNAITFLVTHPTFPSQSSLLLLNSALPPLFACVVRDGRPTAVRMASEETRFSAEGISLITGTLKEASLSLNQVGAAAFVAGPGSFTGIRTGLAMLKGLFFESAVPAVPLSTLDILARPFLGKGKTVVPLIDARLGQVYAAIFGPDGTVLMPDTALAPEDLASRLNGEIVIVGSDAQKFGKTFEAAGSIKAVFENVTPEQWRGDAAALAEENFKAGKSLPVTEMEPVYLRKSYAEIKSGC